MTKQPRHFTIRELITSKEISSQHQLRRELQKKGFVVTQATLSRDLHELGVSRITTTSGSKYILSRDRNRQDIRLLSGKEIISIDNNETAIVIHTLPGCANAVAQYIDAQNYEGILGTVAGDDTILVIPKSVKKISTILNYLRNLLSG